MIRARDSVDSGGTPGMPQNSNFWDAVLSLRPRRERPRSRRAAHERGKFAPSNAECHLIPPAGGGTEG